MLSLAERKEKEKKFAEDLTIFRYDTMKILEIFSKTPLISKLGVKPSVYINELTMPNEERQNFLVRNNECLRLFPDAPPLSVYEKWDVKPRVIFFNNWHLHKQYELCFSIRNKYRCSKMLKLKMASSEVFYLEEIVQMKRLASMVTAKYKVKFNPKELTDYQHTISLYGENESFPIYILAIGPRPIIDLPDRINFTECLVNFKNEKIIPLRNIGQISATIVFETIGEVEVDQQKLTLAPGENHALVLKLETKKLGYINAQLIVTYETGERVYVNILANCKQGNIYTDRNEVQFEETYIGMKSYLEFSLHNRTNHILDFKWLRHKEMSLDLAEWNRVCGYFRAIDDVSRRKLAGLEACGITNEKQHEQVLDRVFEDETLKFRHYAFFMDSCIQVEPQTGSIWPGSAMNFHVTFRPTKVLTYRTVAFLEVNGLDSRIKVSFFGEAIGPKIILNVKSIDFGRCFICSIHRYAVILRNIGLIKGRVRYVPEPSICGGEITCNPQEVELLPEETKLVEINVTSNVAGCFIEDIWFQILESEEKMRCTLKGEIINPRLFLDKHELDFGEVGLGFPKILNFKIKNDSPIAVEIVIRVEGDGYMQAVIIDYDYDHMLPSDPQEFIITPQKTTIGSGEVLNVEVKLISNILRKHKTKCNIYFWDVLLEECSLDVSYVSRTPILVANPPEIVMRYAFTDYEYLHKITICNESDQPTFFSVVPQQNDFNPYLIYRLENSSGFLTNRSCQIVKVFIKVLTLNPCKERIKMKIFGVPYLLNACTIRAFGMGPVVNPSSFTLNWGKIKILEENNKTLQLINVSPITAYYKITVVKRPDVFKTLEKEGSILPNESNNIVVVAKLRDSGKIKDKLWVEIAGSRDVYINLSAYGFGMSILTEPNLFPLFDIGKVFRKEKHNQPVKITNVGSREHTLLFTTMQEIKKMTKMKAAQEQGTYFKLNPYRINLRGGETQEITLSYKWDEEAVLEDTYYCYAIINNQGKRIILGTCTIRATFTDPEFFVEPSKVHYRVDVSHFEKDVGPLWQTLRLTSLWGSSLSVECKLNKPFSFGYEKLKKKMTQYLELLPNSEHQLLIMFDPQNLKSRRTRLYKDDLQINYKGHTVKTFIPLIGEVNFPNLTLFSKVIDFDCIPPCSESMIQVQIKNHSPLVVHFDWLWEDSIITPFKQVPDNKMEDINVPVSPEQLMRNNNFLLNLMNLKKNLESEQNDNIKVSKVFSETTYLLSHSEKTLYTQKCNQLSADKRFKQQHLPAMITHLLIEKYFIEKEEQQTEGAHVSQFQNVLLNYEKQFTGGIPFCVSLPSQSELSPDFKSSSKNINDSFQSLTSLDISDNLKKAIGLSSFGSSQSLPLGEVLPADLINEDIIETHDNLKTKSHLQVVEQFDVPNISKIIDINPCQGVLEPQECLIVTFTFHPQLPMFVEGTAVCRVLGGPEEILEIKGSSFPILFDIFPIKINFGFGPFCEIWCSSIMVWNKSLKQIHVSVATVQTISHLKEESQGLNNLPESVCICPPSSSVKPFQVSVYRIAVFPGRVGEIELPILIQIDNEEPHYIHFVGYAMPSQIHLRIPHNVYPAEEQDVYHSIARMTSDWFQLDLRDQLNIDISNSTLECLLSEINNCYTEGDWDLLMTENDLVPAIDDINMSYERFMCEKYSNKFEGPLPSHIRSKKGCDTLPEFFVQNYVADFGILIAGTKALYGIQYSNYSPKPVVVHIIPPKDMKILDKYGVIFKLVPQLYLAGYEERSFDVFIRPPRDLVQKRREISLVFDFYFTVTCGPIIPVTVKALITQPLLKVPKLIEFEGIKLGYQRVMKFKLKNISKVDCEWVAIVTPPNRPHCDIWRNGKVKNCPFFVKPVYGYLNPNHVTVITVTFEPSDEVPCEVDIHFLANMNSSSPRVRLRGYGIKANLIIKDISFGYSVPFSEALKKNLIVYNPSLFPLEIFVYKRDMLHEHEQKVFNVLFEYYGVEKLCVPSQFYKTRMREEMWNLYRKLAETAIRKHIEDTANYLNIIVRRHFAKTQNSSDISLTKRQSRRNLRRAQSRNWKVSTALTGSPYKKKIPRKGDEYALTVATIEEIIWDYLPTKSLDDIINDYIAFVKYFQCPQSNLALHEDTYLKVYQENVIKHGNALIIHHSPKTHPGLFCLLINKYTGMIPVSIDKEIILELEEGKTEESLFVRDILYNFYLQEKDKFHPSDRDKTKASLLSVHDHQFKPLKSIKDLVAFALSKSRSKKGDLKTKGSRDSSNTLRSGRSFKASSEKFELQPTLLNIPKCYFQAILHRRLIRKMKKGIVIKSLSSKFFTSPFYTLEVLINILKDYNNLNVVSLYASADMFLMLDRGLLNLEIIEEFEKLSGKSILDARPSFIKLVGKEFLEQRKLLSKFSPMDVKKRKGSSKSTHSSKGNVKSSLRPSIRRPKARTTTTHPSVLEAEMKFSNYQRELDGIRNVLDNVDRTKEFQLLKEDVVKPQGPPPRKPVPHRNMSFSITYSNAQPKVDDSIGIPLWILNNYPYQREYQFSEYACLLGSLKNIFSKPSESISVKNKKILSGKSYFIVDKSKQLGPNDPFEHFEVEHQVFKLNPIRKKIKHRKDNISNISVHEEYQVASKSVAFPGALSTSTLMTGSSLANALVTSSVGIDSLMYSIVINNLERTETSLMAELESFLNTCKEVNYSNRQLIKPSRFKSWEVNFVPMGCCDYEDSIMFGISGCNYVKNVNVFAGCDIPDILFKPDNVFSEVNESAYVDMDEVVKPCYILSKHAFHFGVTVVEFSKGRNFVSKTSLKFLNSSNIPVKMTVSIVSEKKLYDREDNHKRLSHRKSSVKVTRSKSLLRKISRKSDGRSKIYHHSISNGKKSRNFKSVKMLFEEISPQESKSEVNKKKVLSNTAPEGKCFDVESSYLHIKVGQIQSLTISAQPIKTGLWSCQYLFSIENNPKVYVLQAFSNGISVHVAFHPKDLHFGDVILYRSATQCFSMDNMSKVPILWKVRHRASLLPQVTLNKYEGLLNPDAYDAIYVTYNAKQVENIVKNLTIDIYAQENKNILLQEHTYPLILKSYSVDLSFCFEMSGNDHLELGYIGVHWEIATEIVITNNGINSVAYSIAVSKKIGEEITVSIEDMYGILKTDEQANCKVSFKINDEVILNKFPILWIEVADFNTEELVAKIPAYLSLQSHYPKYLLSPSQTIDFGDIEIGSVQMVDLTLENVGRVDFSYRICSTPFSSQPPLYFDEFKRALLQNMGKPVKQPCKKLTKFRRKGNMFESVEAYLDELWVLKKILNYQKNSFSLERISKKLNMLLKNSPKNELQKCLVRRKKINSTFKIKHRRKMLRKMLHAFTQKRVLLKNIGEILPSLKSFIDNNRSIRFKNTITEPRIGRQLFFDGLLSLYKGQRYNLPPFEIDPSDGTVPSEEYQIIKIYCFPRVEGSFEKEFLLKVKNASPELKNLSLNLRGRCTVPRINFEDYESVFCEFEIVDDLHSQVGCIHNNGMPFGIFSRQKKKMYFCNVIVNSEASFNIYFQSENQLPASVEISILGVTENVFSIFGSDTGKVFVSPYESSSVPITFSPTSLDIYTATVLLVLKTQSDFEVSHASFRISGLGHIPRVELNKINTSDTNLLPPKLDFGCIHLGASIRQSFAIKNVGTVISEVLIELASKSDAFSLKYDEDVLKNAVNEPLFNGELKPTTLFRIVPENEISFEVEFQPEEEKAYSSSIIVHIVYNPFEMITLKLNGEAFSNDVVITGPNISIITNQYLFAFPANLSENVEYNLDFGVCVAMKKYSQLFSLMNCANHIIRFEFDYSNPGIIFIPSVGHIYQESVKDIKAILFTTSPGDVLIDVTCRLEGITYREEIAPQQTQWDNSLKVISWLNEEKDQKNKLDIAVSSSLKESYAAEPDCLSTSFRETNIFLHIKAFVDLPTFTVIPTDIEFSCVLVGQIVEETVNITNESNVEARYSLDIIEDSTLDSDKVPDLYNFTFGHFHCNLNELPGGLEEFELANENPNWPLNYPEELEDYLEDSGLEIFNVNTQMSKIISDWRQIKIKHYSILYGKPVTLAKDFPELNKIDSVSNSKTTLAVQSNQRLSPNKEAGVTDTVAVPKEEKSAVTKLLHVDQNAIRQKNNYLALEEAKSIADNSSVKLMSDTIDSVFKTDPGRGVIKPHETVECKITFHPRHIETYKSSLRLVSKDTGVEKIIQITGTGILPLCHVEIDDNDYLNEVGTSFTSIPSRTKAIIVTSFNSDDVIKKTFNVYNITEIPFHFKWYCLKENSFDHKFLCHTSEGVIAPRSRYEMIFSFCPSEYGIYEALWIMCINEFILQQPFLFVGMIRDPQVDIEPKTVVLKPSLGGYKSRASVELKNLEKSVIQFSVEKESLLSCFNCAEQININPTIGEILPENSVNLDIEFMSKAMKQQIFNPVIKIDSTKKVIRFKIVSKSYEIIPVLSCVKEDFEKVPIEPTDCNKYNIISIGKVNLKVPYTLLFTLLNIGNISLYFECFFPEDIDENISIDIGTRQGVVLPSNEINFPVKITALQKTHFKQSFVIKVTKGPDFCIQLCGNAVFPICRFSFDSHDFGICLIQESDPVLNSVILEFSNLDTEPILLETNGCKEGFCVNFKSLVIEPRAVHKILILFNPTEPKKYHEILKFTVNSVSEHEIVLSGEGDSLQLEIENPEDRLVNFGLVPVGKTVSRQVNILNRSRTTIQFSLHAQEITTKSRNAKRFLEPFDKKIELAPREIFSVKVLFHAKEKVQHLNCKVYYKAYGIKKDFFLVKASIIDYEIHLDQSFLFFGSTVVGCSSTLKVGLVNSGDIGTRFRIITQFVSDVFLIKPLKGYSPPGSTTVVEVIFVPNNIMQYCNNVLVFLLDNYHTLTLGMMGVGVKLPLASATIKFITKVRKGAIQTITLNNRTFVEQIVRPIVEGDYFSGPEAVSIPPKDSIEYEINYYPLTQTKNLYHEGSLFCNYNNGEALLYKLVGTALSPTFEKTLRWYCCPRVKKRGKILFENWSPNTETFSVAVKCIDIQPPTYFEIERNDVICVPPKGKRNFTLGVTVYKECLMCFKVLFKNINSGELIKYKVVMNTSPTPLSLPIKLRSVVREGVSYKIPIYNPMDKRAVFSFRSPHPDIKPSKKKIVVKPNKKGFLKIKYIPLTTGYYDSVKVEVTNYLLGRVILVFNLEAVSCIAQEDYVVNSNLGVQESFQITIKNPTSSLLTCFPTANSADLTFSKTSFNIPPGKLYKIDTLYLPSQIGTQLINARIKTNRFGTICVPVKGICQLPKPQGPFMIAKNEAFKLTFQNVLRDPTQFTCEVNSPEFQTSVHNFFLKPGMDQNIEVEFIKIKQSSSLLDRQMSSCKLSIWCYTKDKSIISWIYYLLGEI